MKLSDFKGNFKQINEIKKIIFDKDNFSTILIIGDNCTGKSSFHQMIKEENKFDILFLNDSLNFNEQTIQNFVQCKTITSFFYTLEKLIFIDDIDTISTMNKQIMSLLTSFKSKCKMIFTVKSKEEKKLMNLMKKFFDHKIYLKKIDYKDCFAILLKYTEDREDIDNLKLLQLIKTQDCNIHNIIMLLDSVTYKNEDIDVLNNNMDMYHSNIYNMVGDIYKKDLDDSYINSLSNKDNSIISSMVHENIVNIKTDIDKYISLYTILSECDIIDKHIYINCAWGINWDMLNYYRFKNFNIILHKTNNNITTINFTQQFTKLSSQMNIKKKLHSFSDSIYLTNTFDILHHLNVKKYSIKDKIIKDLLAKYQKDFYI